MGRYDSFAGGLARGLANAQQRALQQEEQERLDKIAKLEGQLTEQKLKEQNRLEKSRQFISDRLNMNQRLGDPSRRPIFQDFPQTPGSTLDAAIQRGRYQPKKEQSLLDILAQPQALAAISEYTPLLNIQQQQQDRKMMQNFLGSNGSSGSGLDGMNIASVTMKDGKPSLKFEPSNRAKRGSRPGGIPVQYKGHTLTMTASDNMQGQPMLETAVPMVGESIEVEIDNEKRLLRMLGGHLEGTEGYKAALEYMRERNAGGANLNQPGDQPSLDAMSQKGAQTQTPPPGILVKEAERNKPYNDEGWNLLRNKDGARPNFNDRRLSKQQMRDKGFARIDKDTLKAVNNATFMVGRIDNLQTQYESLFPRQTDGNIDPNAVPTAQQFANAPPVNLRDLKFNNTTQYASEEELLAESDYFQAVKDRFAVAAGKGEQSQALRLYFDQYLSLAVQIARNVLGEVGTMTEGDVARALGILPFPGVEVDDRGHIKYFNLRQADTFGTGMRKINYIKSLINDKPEVKNWRGQFDQKTDLEKALEEKARRQQQT